jgi:hypothetical protein
MLDGKQLEAFGRRAGTRGFGPAAIALKLSLAAVSGSRL